MILRARRRSYGPRRRKLARFGSCSACHPYAHLRLRAVIRWSLLSHKRRAGGMVHAAGLVRAVVVLSTFSRCQMEQKIPFRASMVPTKRGFLLHLETARWRYVLSCVNARVYAAVCDNGRHVKRWRLPWRWTWRLPWAMDVATAAVMDMAMDVAAAAGDGRGHSASASTRGLRGNMAATESGLRGEMHEAGSYRHLGACGCR